MKSQNTSPKGIWYTKTVNPTVSVCLLSKAFRNFLERCRIIKVNNKTIMVPRKCPRRQPLNCKDLVLLGYKSIPLCLWRECELSDSWCFYLFKYKLWLPFLTVKRKQNSSGRIKILCVMVPLYPKNLAKEYLIFSQTLTSHLQTCLAFIPGLAGANL